MVHQGMCLEPETGQIGIKCDTCGKRLTYGQAMVVDQKYLCWEHYVASTGAQPSTVGKENAPRILK